MHVRDDRIDGLVMMIDSSGTRARKRAAGARNTGTPNVCPGRRWGSSGNTLHLTTERGDKLMAAMRMGGS